MRSEIQQFLINKFFIGIVKNIFFSIFMFSKIFCTHVQPVLWDVSIFMIATERQGMKMWIPHRLFIDAALQSAD